MRSLEDWTQIFDLLLKEINVKHLILPVATVDGDRLVIDYNPKCGFRWMRGPTDLQAEQDVSTPRLMEALPDLLEQLWRSDPVKVPEGLVLRPT